MNNDDSAVFFAKTRCHSLCVCVMLNVVLDHDDSSSERVGHVEQLLF